MAQISKTFGKTLLPLAAMSLSVFGLTAATMAHETPSDLPVTCQIAVSDGAFGPTYKGLVTANTAVDGSYQMTFLKIGANSASINQSGVFALQPGETATGGQASLGASGNVEAKLTIRFDGKKMICQTPGAVDL